MNWVQLLIKHGFNGAQFSSLNSPRFLWRKEVQEKSGCSKHFFNILLTYVLRSWLWVLLRGVADPHLKSQVKFTWNEFCIYIHSQDNNQASPKANSRLWFFLTQNFSLPVCHPVYNYFYPVKSPKQSTHAFFNLFASYVYCNGFSQVVLVVKNLPANAGDMRWGFNHWVQKITWRRALQPTPISAWRIPWTEEPGGLQSRGSHRVTEADTSEQLRTAHICKSIVFHTLY